MIEHFPPIDFNYFVILCWWNPTDTDGNYVSEDGLMREDEVEDNFWIINPVPVKLLKSNSSISFAQTILKTQFELNIKVAFAS